MTPTEPARRKLGLRFDAPPQRVEICGVCDRRADDPDTNRCTLVRCGLADRRAA